MNWLEKIANLQTPGASVQMGVAGFPESFQISTPDGASITGYVTNADFPEDSGSATRGELFFSEVPEDMRRRGIGKSLCLDALRLLKQHGAETVNASPTSDEGRHLVSSLVRSGFLVGPIRQSDSGKAEYQIGI